MPDQPNGQPADIAVTVDARTLTYRRSDTGPGTLIGDPDLLEAVRATLAAAGPRSVRVIEPNIDYTFSAGRDQPADIAAAMLTAAGGRGELNDAGWDAITDTLGIDTTPTAPTDSPLIY
jgi:hypothetical protein